MKVDPRAVLYDSVIRYGCKNFRNIATIPKRTFIYIKKKINILQLLHFHHTTRCKSVVRNPQLKYASARIIKKASSYGDYFYSYHFYKLLFNVFLNLKEKGVDIQLPYSWYFYGDLIESETFEYMTGATLGYFAPSNGKLQHIIEVPNYGLDVNTIQKIDLAINEEFSEIIENNHYKKDYGQILLKKVYQNAPLEFQRVFNRGIIPFILEFKPKKGQMILFPLLFDDANLRILNDYLDKLIINFPDSKLPEIYEVFLEWDDTVRLAELNDHSQIVDLVLEFCRLYGGLLRVKENQNILPHVTNRWATNFSDEIYPEYIKNLEGIRDNLLKAHFSTIDPDEKTKNIVEKMMQLGRDLSFEELNGD